MTTDPSQPHARPCVQCRTPPPAAPIDGTLYLSPPADEPRASLLAVFAADGVPVVERDDGTPSVRVSPGL